MKKHRLKLNTPRAHSDVQIYLHIFGTFSVYRSPQKNLDIQTIIMYTILVACE